MKALKIIGAIVVIFVVAFAGVFWLTGGISDAATGFFQTVAKDGAKAAYDSASPAFRSSVTPDGFETFAAANGLSRFKSASWTNRHVEGNQARLVGSITLDDGSPRPATVNLVKGDDRVWRVLSVDFEQAGVATSRPSSDAAPQQVAQANASSPPAAEPVATAQAQTPEGIEHVESVNGVPPGTFEKVQAYLRQPLLASMAREQFVRVEQSLPGYCPSMKWRSSNLLILRGPVFDTSSGIAGGTFRESWTGQGCGDAHPVLNLWTVSAPNQPPHVFQSYPGSSIADPQVQRDLLPIAQTSAAARVPSCGNLGVVDTHFDTYEGDPIRTVNGRMQRPWREEWLMTGCSHAVKIVMHFVPDASGTSGVSHPTDSVLLQ
ncbi:hypothetical protein [Paraburkholderia phosphatilytica]|uniref:DUF4864 domain-containing protein n=1 Tax=Paraburkholderia phosphatilytica TaxID=2282883 RepID=UPI000E534EEE|nr:hypothetical protein [Paraburkholderia phosphatilytica]